MRIGFRGVSQVIAAFLLSLAAASCTTASLTGERMEITTNKVFKPRGYIKVPDGTEVSAFLNAVDSSQSDVPWGLLGDVSIASGRIGPRILSWVHRMPVSTQVTYVVSGKLTVRMKDRAQEPFWSVELSPGEAVVTQPGTFLQLRNETDQTAEVLYIVSPAYVFEQSEDKKIVVHDDSVMVAKSWEAIESSGHTLPMSKEAIFEARARRTEALRRLAAKKGH